MQSIQMLRKKRGLSQDELATKLHVDQSTISKWENGHAQPSLNMMEKLAAFFGVPITLLFDVVEDVDAYQQTAYIQVIKERGDAGPDADKQEKLFINYAVPQAEKNDYFAYCIQEDSLLPDFQLNDLLIIKRTNFYEKGALLLADFSGTGRQSALYRLRQVSHGLILLPLDKILEPVLVEQAVYDQEQRLYDLSAMASQSVSGKLHGKVIELRRRFL